MSKDTSSHTIRTKPLITPKELAKEFPVKITQKQFVEQSRETVTRILNGEDRRLLLILGPCSIHDPLAAIEYAKKLLSLKKAVSDAFFPVMRVYFEKPRTLVGWKGMMHDPHLDGTFDLNTGLKMTRRLLSELAEIEVPAAAEILDPISGQYFGDLLSWGCIGARTSSSQLHRQVASGLPMPIAFKNNTDGNYDVAIHGILTASHPHAYIGINSEGTASIFYTQGNPHCHLVLRGSESGPNYDPTSVNNVIKKLLKAKLPPSLLIDCSHDNSRRDHKKQPQVFGSVIEQIKNGNDSIRGCILESHLFPGSQPIPENLQNLKYAVSLTDSCMDWETTENLIFNAKKTLYPSQEHSTDVDHCPSTVVPEPCEVVIG